MIIPTSEVVNALVAKGFVRDDSQPYGYVGYCGANREWLVLDESFAIQDTDHVIEDCLANECYAGATAMKALADEWVTKRDRQE